MLNYARENHHQANSLAANLHTNKNNTTIGIILPEITHHFFTVLADIEQIANESKLNILVHQANEQYKREVRDVRTHSL